MTDESRVLAESNAAEAVNAIAVAKEAEMKAHESQMHNTLVMALREVLTDGDGSPMLIKRIPFICNDIKWIKTLLWTILSANGLVLMSLIGIAIQRAFS